MKDRERELSAALARRNKARADSDAFDGGYPATDEGRAQSLFDANMIADAYTAERTAHAATKRERDELLSASIPLRASQSQVKDLQSELEATRAERDVLLTREQFDVELGALAARFEAAGRLTLRRLLNQVPGGFDAFPSHLKADAYKRLGVEPVEMYRRLPQATQ